MKHSERWLDALPRNAPERELIAAAERDFPPPGSVDRGWNALCAAVTITTASVSIGVAVVLAALAVALLLAAVHFPVRIALRVLLVASAVLGLGQDLDLGDGGVASGVCGEAVGGGQGVPGARGVESGLRSVFQHGRAVARDVSLDRCARISHWASYCECPRP